MRRQQWKIGLGELTCLLGVRLKEDKEKEYMLWVGVYQELEQFVCMGWTRKRHEGCHL